MYADKFLYYPVKPFIVGQKFGENTACIDNATNSKVIHCDGLKPPKGYRSVYSQMKGHNGLDVGASRWTPVYSSSNGSVIEVSTEEARGLGVGVLSPVLDSKTGKYKHFKIRYWHFVALNVHESDRVKIGQLLGWADSTGFSSGDHLHFEVKLVNKKGTKNLLQDNGFFGAIDPSPYFYEQYAIDFNIVRKARQKSANWVDKFSDWLRSF